MPFKRIMCRAILRKIAKAISGQFKRPMRKLYPVVTRYYEQDTWKDNLVVEEASTLLQDIGGCSELAKRTL